MRYHSEHAPRHTKSFAHTGNKMRNIKNQLLGWVLIACLVCTTVALPTQRTDAFVPVAPLVGPAIGGAVTTYSPLVVGFFTAYVSAKITDKIMLEATQEACRKNFGKNICQNVNPVSATVSAITVAAMVISDTCKGMDVVTCGKKLWEKFSKFIQETLNKSKVKNGKFILDTLRKCFSKGSCTQKDWAYVFGATESSKTSITWKSQQGSGSTTANTTSTKPQTTASQKNPTPTKKSGQYPGIHSEKGKALFEQIKKREEILKTHQKRSDLSSSQKKQIEEELKRIQLTKSTLSSMQKRMEEQNKSGPTFSQTDNKAIQETINVERGVLNTLAVQTDKILGTFNSGVYVTLVKNPVTPIQSKDGATQEANTSTKQTLENLKVPNNNLSKKLLNHAYPDSAMGLSSGKDPLSDGVTPQYGDPSMRVERGKCTVTDNNAIVMHLLEKMRKKITDERPPITNLKLIQTAYGLMLQGVLNGAKTVYILPCVPIAGFNTFFVGTMAELQALLKSAQAQGKLRYGVKGRGAAEVVEKVTKPI